MKPRLCRLDNPGFAPVRGHNPLVSALGALFLWVGWYAFNTYPALDLEDQENVTVVLGRVVRLGRCLGRRLLVLRGHVLLRIAFP